jgi:hypothetical protein
LSGMRHPQPRSAIHQVPPPPTVDKTNYLVVVLALAGIAALCFGWESGDRWLPSSSASSYSRTFYKTVRYYADGTSGRR